MILAFPIFLAAVSLATCQVINLRDRDQQYHFSRVTMKPGTQINDNIPIPKPPAKFLAKPGNVIVHFDRQHEIQQLQYVLQDGRLATLYQRHPQHPNNSRMPQQIPSSIETPAMIHRREETAGQPSTPKEPTGAPEVAKELADPRKPSEKPPVGSPKSKQQPILIDDDSTIEILDVNMNKISKLIGDHLTIAIPDNPTGTAGNATSGAEDTEDERLDILATIAVDTMAHVGEEKFHKASILMDKIKTKVAAKLRDLPSLIEAKLRSKSSAGQTYLDQHGKVIKVVSETQPASGEKHIDNRRLVPVPANYRLNYPSQMQLSPQRLIEA